MSKKNKTRICIIGMPGSGKSTIGSLLSEKLKYRFIDLDNEIEINTGLKIKEIFKDMGEDSFRKIETDTLNKLIHKDRIVISWMLRYLGNGTSKMVQSYIYLICFIKTKILTPLLEKSEHFDVFDPHRGLEAKT